MGYVEEWMSSRAGGFELNLQEVQPEAQLTSDR